MKRLAWGALAGALILMTMVALAGAQTAPAGFCGFARVGIARSITNGAAAIASQSVASTTSSGPPTIPTMTAGSVVGAMVDVEQAAIRFRTDGTAPTGNFDGRPAAAGSTWTVCGTDLTNWNAIASSSGANAILRWTFYGPGA